MCCLWQARCRCQAGFRLALKEAGPSLIKHPLHALRSVAVMCRASASPAWVLQLRGRTYRGFALAFHSSPH